MNKKKALHLTPSYPEANNKTHKNENNKCNFDLTCAYKKTFIVSDLFMKSFFIE
jgi:hypothetical protein